METTTRPSNVLIEVFVPEHRLTDDMRRIEAYLYDGYRIVGVGPDAQHPEGDWVIVVSCPFEGVRPVGQLATLAAATYGCRIVCMPTMAHRHLEAFRTNRRAAWVDLIGPGEVVRADHPGAPAGEVEFVDTSSILWEGDSTWAVVAWH